MPEISDKSKLGRWPQLLLILVVIAAATLRFPQTREGLWLDELHTAWTISDGVGSIPERANMGNQSSLYFYLPWLTSSLFGMHELPLRLPSMIAGILFILASFWLVWRMTRSSTAGLLTALLITVDRDCIFYAQEARVYVCVQLVGVLHIAVFAKLLEQPAWRTRSEMPARPGAPKTLRIVLIVGAVCLFYLHYTAVLLIAGEAVAYLALWLWPRWRPHYRWHEVLIDLAIVVLCCLPAWGHLSEIAERRENWAIFIKKQPFEAVFSTFSLRTYLLIPLAACAAFWLGRLIFKFARTSETGNAISAEEQVESRFERGLIVAFCSLFVPLLATWTSTHFDLAPLFFGRYVIVSLCAALVLSGLLLSSCRNVFLQIIAIGVLIVVTFQQSQFIEHYRAFGRIIGDRRQDWQGAIQFINERAKPTEPVFVRSGLIEANALRRPHNESLRQFCLLPVTGIYKLDHPERLEPLTATIGVGQLTPDQLEMIVERGRAWVLIVHSRPSVVKHVESVMIASARARRVRLRAVERQAFLGLTVLKMERQK